jgi:hypothetical protein
VTRIIPLMRNLLGLVPLALLLAACDPTIKKFEVTPTELPCPGNVKLTWEGDADGGRVQADTSVSPPLPDTVLKTGTLTEKVSATTTFMYFFPSAAHREKTVTVKNAKCGTGPGPGCGPQTIALTGNCTSSANGPSYDTQSLTILAAPGKLVQIVSDADFPVHVSHNGKDIALGAGGAPIGMLPVVDAAGAYTITVPGQAGPNICAGAGGPTGGDMTEAPTVHLTITPTCPP